VAYDQDGDRIVSGGEDGFIKIWDSNKNVLLGSAQHSEDVTVLSVAFSTDGKLVASGANDGTIVIWNSNSMSRIASILHNQKDDDLGEVNSVAFSHDGKRIASGGDDGFIRIWSSSTGKAIGEPLDYGYPIASVAFSPDPDSNLIVSGSFDDNIQIWTGEKNIILYGHRRNVNSVVFNNDGKYIASGADDGSVRLWNIETVSPINHIIQNNGAPIYSVAFSPDGKTVASADEHGLSLWDKITYTSVSVLFQDTSVRLKIEQSQLLAD
jgi:WD40 repeat protein